MKSIIKTVFIILFLFSSVTILHTQDLTQLVAQCAANAGNVTYLKDFIVKLDPGTPGGAPPTARFAMILSKNAMYRFSVCTAPTSEGDAVLQLMDMNRLLGSTFIQATGKEYPYFDFKCQKTGVYHVFISFKEGKAGEAVSVLSLVKKF